MLRQMKDPLYKAKCIDKILSKHSSLEVMEGLADIAFDIFQLSLKDEGKIMPREEIKRQIEEFNQWKKTTLRD